MARDVNTGNRVALAHIPKPHSAWWEWEARKVDYQNLQSIVRDHD